MFLGWYEQGLGGTMPEMPARGYKWSQTPKLNRAIWEKHRSRSRAAVMAAFDSGYSRIVQMVETLSPEQLLTAGHFSWTGKHPLTTYLGPNTASHYRFAIKVINRWLKRVPAPNTSAARPNNGMPTTRKSAPSSAARVRRIEQGATMTLNVLLEVASEMPGRCPTGTIRRGNLCDSLCDANPAPNAMHTTRNHAAL